jgi:Heavy metal binding domain
MKKSTVPFIFLIAVLFVATALVTSCGNKKTEQATEEHHAESDTTSHHEDMPMDSTQTAYACPMHPEVTGKDGDKCSKCGMKLELVKSADGTRVN